MSKLPDYVANDISVQDIHRTILSEGCCLLRQAIDRSSLTKLITQIDLIYQKKSHLVRTENVTDGDIRCHIYDREFQETYPGQSLYDLLENTKFYPLLESLFGAGKFYRSDITNCRSVDARPEAVRDLTSFTPLPLHIDAPYHPPADKFTINFWIPLNDGCGIDKPGIQVAPMSHIKVREILEYDSKVGFPDQNNANSPWSMDNVKKRIVQKCPDATIWRPTFSMGDVMIMTSWIPHASYAPANSLYHRKNLEIRHYGEEIDPCTI